MLPHEPKYSHMERLHTLLAEYAEEIITTAAQLNNAESLVWFNNDTQAFESGTQQMAWIYGTTGDEFIFIENQADVTIQVSPFFKNILDIHINPVPWSELHITRLFCYYS